MRRSAEQIAEIAKLWQEGKSARQIGEILGVTRNVIIGLVHRNGIKREGNPVTKAMIEQRRAAGRKGGEATAEKGRAVRIEKAPLVPPKPKAIRPEQVIDPTGFWRKGHSAESLNDRGSKPLVEAQWYDCRFPLGRFDEVATHICAAPRRNGSSFCDAHHRLVYRGTVAEIRKAEGKPLPRAAAPRMKNPAVAGRGL